MSWDGYIDNIIQRTRAQNGEIHSDKASIIGLANGAKWTSDAHANVSLCIKKYKPSNRPLNKKISFGAKFQLFVMLHVIQFTLYLRL